MDSVDVRFQFCARARSEARSQNDTSAASREDAWFHSGADAGKRRAQARAGGLAHPSTKALILRVTLRTLELLE